MLLFQKSVVEGSLALLLYCSKLSDLIHVEEGEAKERASLLLDLLTPIAKSYPSEMCCLSTSAAVQVLGGAGYTTDFTVEQYYREARIHPIHEGTTGIHGLDLLGRKITIHNGKAAQIFFEEVSKTMTEASENEDLQPFVEKLQKSLGKAQQTTGYLLGLAGKGETEKFLADATLYLEMFGIITIAWQWLNQGIVAKEKLNDAHEADQSFYQGKLATMRYFYEYELVKVDSLVKRLQSTDSVTIEMQSDWF
jgi:butyryl-CoA dehydrogenase